MKWQARSSSGFSEMARRMAMVRVHCICVGCEAVKWQWEGGVAVATRRVLRFRFTEGKATTKIKSKFEGRLEGKIEGNKGCCRKVQK